MSLAPFPGFPSARNNPTYDLCLRFSFGRVKGDTWRADGQGGRAWERGLEAIDITDFQMTEGDERECKESSGTDSLDSRAERLGRYLSANLNFQPDESDCLQH